MRDWPSQSPGDSSASTRMLDHKRRIKALAKGEVPAVTARARAPEGGDLLCDEGRRTVGSEFSALQLRLLKDI